MEKIERLCPLLLIAAGGAGITMGLGLCYTVRYPEDYPTFYFQATAVSTGIVSLFYGVFLLFNRPKGLGRDDQLFVVILGLAGCVGIMKQTFPPFVLAWTHKYRRYFLFHVFDDMEMANVKLAKSLGKPMQIVMGTVAAYYALLIFRDRFVRKATPPPPS